MYLWLIDLVVAEFDELLSCVVAASSRDEAWKITCCHPQFCKQETDKDDVIIRRIGNTWMDSGLVHENVNWS